MNTRMLAEAIKAGSKMQPVKDTGALPNASMKGAEGAAMAIRLWLAGFKSERTKRAYSREMRAFATYCDMADVATCAAHFLALEDSQAHIMVDAYRADKIRAKLSPSAINLSMSALNSFTRSARRHGYTKLRLEAKGVKSQSYRDTRGPGTDGVQKLLEAARQQEPKKAARDIAIIRLLFGNALRRNEVVNLNIGNVDLAGSMIWIEGKGRAEREPITIAQNTKEALAAWLAYRADQDQSQPLFVNLSRHGDGSKRITGDGIYSLIRHQLGKRAGIETRPHGLRHTAITKALDVFNGDYRKARSFSRHESLQTVRRYDDNRADHAGQVSQAIDALVK